MSNTQEDVYLNTTVKSHPYRFQQGDRCQRCRWRGRCCPSCRTSGTERVRFRSPRRPTRRHSGPVRSEVELCTEGKVERWRGELQLNYHHLHCRVEKPSNVYCVTETLIWTRCYCCMQCSQSFYTTCHLWKFKVQQHRSTLFSYRQFTQVYFNNKIINCWQNQNSFGGKGLFWVSTEYLE